MLQANSVQIGDSTVQNWIVTTSVGMYTQPITITILLFFSSSFFPPVRPHRHVTIAVSNLCLCMYMYFMRWFCLLPFPLSRRLQVQVLDEMGPTFCFCFAYTGGFFFSFSCCNCVIRCMYVLALAVDGVNCFVLSQRNAPNASPETDEQTDRTDRTDIHIQTTYYTPPAFFPSFPSHHFSPPPPILSHTPPPPLLLLPTLYLSCPLSRKSRSPLFLLNRQIVPFFFLSSFRAVRYWARQLGNRRHFRTVPAQPTHVCPHISSTHPPSIHPSNPFFSLHTTTLPPLLFHTDKTLLVVFYFIFTFSLLQLKGRPTFFFFLVITRSACPTELVSHLQERKEKKIASGKKKKKLSSARFLNPLISPSTSKNAQRSPRPRSPPPPFASSLL